MIIWNKNSFYQPNVFKRFNFNKSYVNFNFNINLLLKNKKVGIVYLLILQTF